MFEHRIECIYIILDVLLLNAERCFTHMKYIDVIPRIFVKKLLERDSVVCLMPCTVLCVFIVAR
jgi:hypothetical protein